LVSKTLEAPGNSPAGVAQVGAEEAPQPPGQEFRRDGDVLQPIRIALAVRRHQRAADIQQGFHVPGEQLDIFFISDRAMAGNEGLGLPAAHLAQRLHQPLGLAVAEVGVKANEEQVAGENDAVLRQIEDRVAVGVPAGEGDQLGAAPVAVERRVLVEGQIGQALGELRQGINDPLILAKPEQQLGPFLGAGGLIL